MCQGTCSVVAAFSLMLIFPAIGASQSLQTPNTIKLDEDAARPKATLADAKLLVGHWRGEFLGAMAEEHWLPAAGGSMLGVFRLYEGEKTMFYELMVVVEEEGSVSMKLKHFGSDLKGWEEKDDMKTFRLVKATADALWFEGLTFRKQPDGSLQGFIAIRGKDGTVKEETFVYRPVKDEKDSKQQGRGDQK